MKNRKNLKLIATIMASSAMMMSSAAFVIRPHSVVAPPSNIIFSSVATADHDHNLVPQEPPKKNTPKKKADDHHKNGIFSPVVLAAKGVLGEERLNKIRGNAISLHSDVIGRFVDTAETEFGQTMLRKLFELADINKNGVIEEDELVVALQALGFGAFLKEKQLKGIFARADRDENGSIDMEEWLAEAPRTLRTNLVKLAKKNGGDLGFLV
ncbi:hypothetical protein FisN_30Lh094 [Fistulifera solaris]|uniref:EF-hand domain-containing protein n=1 Tax=Fistulifera solaris TaxID=1519565 RepID=A0A1Z5JII0_FISSO|nr:hypothetical protein FisN_30Lh094 [Fistulifera solaris]|eukprot:GAX13799.1 hypothetical protein FisN_30Lh094 [Fistulifera solaris]